MNSFDYEQLQDGSIVRLVSLARVDQYYDRKEEFLGHQFIVRVDYEDFPLLKPLTPSKTLVDRYYLFMYFSEEFKVEVVTPINVN